MQNPAPADVPHLKRRDDLTVVEFQQRSNVYLALNFEYTELGVERFNAYDPHRASSLLDEAGWRRGSDGTREKEGVRLACEVIGHDDPMLRTTLDLVAEMLHQVGIEITPRYETPFGPFVSAIVDGVPAFLSKWLWADPFEGVQAFTASWARPAPNWQQAHVPALDDAYRTWWTATSERELAMAASQAQVIAAEQLPLLPLFTPNTIWVCTDRIHGWRPTERNLYPFYQGVWKEPSPKRVDIRLWKFCCRRRLHRRRSWPRVFLRPLVGWPPRRMSAIEFPMTFR